MSELSNELGRLDGVVTQVEGVRDIRRPDARVEGRGENGTRNVVAIVVDGRLNALEADAYWRESTPWPEQQAAFAEAVNGALVDHDRRFQEQLARTAPDVDELRSTIAEAQQRVLDAMTADMDELIRRAERAVR